MIIIISQYSYVNGQTISSPIMVSGIRGMIIFSIEFHILVVRAL